MAGETKSSHLKCCCLQSNHIEILVKGCKWIIWHSGRQTDQAEGRKPLSCFSTSFFFWFFALSVGCKSSFDSDPPPRNLLKAFFGLECQPGASLELCHSSGCQGLLGARGLKPSGCHARLIEPEKINSYQLAGFGSLKLNEFLGNCAMPSYDCWVFLF